MAFLLLMVVGALAIPIFGYGIATGNTLLILAGGALLGGFLAGGIHLALRRPPRPGKGRLFGI